MSKEYQAEELNKLSNDALVSIILSMQSQLFVMTDQLKRMQDNTDKLIEELALARQFRFGRSTEKLECIDGQLNLFNEVEAIADIDPVEEPEEEEVLRTVSVRKHPGKREEDLRGLPVNQVSHELTEEQLIGIFGSTGSWKELPEEVYKRVQYRPARFIVDEHHVHVYSGKDNQTIVKADRPKDLLRNSIATPSLVAAVMNAKYVNALPLHRIEQEFRRNDVNISRQVMANWVIRCSENYLSLMYDRMKQEMLSAYPVLQADETPVEISKDGRPAGSKSYMWVYRTGKYFAHPIILYDYEKTRGSENPNTFLDGFEGKLLSDGYSAYSKLSRDRERITMVNCWAHARRKFSDACKVLKDRNKLKSTIAYEALERIARIYKLDNELSGMPPDERRQKRDIEIRPHVEEFFAWAKRIRDNREVISSGKTMEGIEYCLKRETELSRFLDDGNIPLDNNATEGALRGFCIGRNNWRMIDTISGAEASATVYSLVETAKANGLRPHVYLEHLLTKILENCDGHSMKFLDELLPWSETLPEDCRKKN